MSSDEPAHKILRDRETLSKRASNYESKSESESENEGRKSESSKQEIIASKRNKQNSMKQLVDQQQARSKPAP